MVEIEELALHDVTPSVACSPPLNGLARVKPVRTARGSLPESFSVRIHVRAAGDSISVGERALLLVEPPLYGGVHPEGERLTHDGIYGFLPVVDIVSIDTPDLGAPALDAILESVHG